jgi:hypothetical protein
MALSIGTKQNLRPGRIRLRSARRHSPALLASILSADEVFGIHTGVMFVVFVIFFQGQRRISFCRRPLVAAARGW